MDDLTEFVRAQSIFAGLNARQIEFLASVAWNVEYAAGKVIFAQDTEAHHFYVLLEGEATLELPGPVPFPIQTIRAGEVLGLSWLYPPHRWALTAVADRHCRVLVFDAEAVRRECEVNHELGYRLYARFVEVAVRRLQAARLALSELRQLY